MASGCRKLPLVGSQLGEVSSSPPPLGIQLNHPRTPCREPASQAVPLAFRNISDGCGVKYLIFLSFPRPTFNSLHGVTKQIHCLRWEPPDQVGGVGLLLPPPWALFSKINSAIVDIMASMYFRTNLSSPSKSPAGILNKIT